MPNDTHPDADDVQFDRFRQMTPEDRLARALELSAMTSQMARRAIAKANPELNGQEQRVLFVEICHGKELADRFRAHLGSL